MKIFFNSSMPRSGSTLLQNILGNHPEIYATPTSPVFQFLNVTRNVFTQDPCVKSQDEIEMKNAYTSMLKYALHGYFYGITDKKYVIDKSRAWGLNYDFLNTIVPNPKIVCMVRDLRDILASMEKRYRKYPNMQTAPPTLPERISKWLEYDTKPVGFTLNNLQEVFQRKNDDKILFIKYEDLTTNPQKQLNIIHNYLGLNNYKYDFKDIRQVTYENDKFHGIYGDHIIKREVKPVPSEAKKLLGEPICNLIYERIKWYFEKFNYTQ